MLKWFRFVLPFVLAVVLIVVPVQAAERIYFSYGLLGFSVTVDQLEAFAQNGNLEGRLKQVLGRFPPERRSQIQQVLLARYPVDPVMADRFAYTASGERLLQEIGEIVQSEARQNGDKGLRSAMILAADDPQGISIIGFLRQFPTDIRINIPRLLQLIDRVSHILRATQQTVADLNQQTAQNASQTNVSTLSDLRQPGADSYQQQTLTLYDQSRDRRLTVGLYLPDRGLSNSPATVPLIVMSNGLGAGRDRFDEIAHHLASHGFAIAMPDHPGSDRQRLREFYAGLHQENFDATEYIDRPKDITFLLNQLETLNQTQLNHRLNLERVGIFGYSFGGSTALSLAGATIDFEFLENDCNTEMGLVNISLLYQCRALELPSALESLRDDRIQAAFVFVPFGKSLFGQTGMAKVDIPVFWEVTDLDILTPLAVEQIPAFKALVNTDKYFAVTQGLPHARVTYDAISKITRTNTSWEDLKWIGHNYQNALSLAFFKTYIAGEPNYQSYLTAAYAKALTEEPYLLSLVEAIESGVGGEE